MLKTLTDIPVLFDNETLMQRARVLPETDDSRRFAELLDLARQCGRPKAAYRACFVEARDTESVTIDGVRFNSHTLARNLASTQRVFPCVATCGQEIDAIRLPGDDPLEAYWLDIIKTALLMAAHSHLTAYLTHRFALGKTASMSPGSGDADIWPLTEQKPLFALLGDVREAIGVELTDSLLMMPIKTISGIRFPTEHDFRSCQVCHRPHCTSRSAPFDATLWNSLQHP